MKSPMRWIRANVPVTENEYHEFLSEFVCDGETASLRVSSETDYCAYLNGKVVAYGQFDDLAGFKVCDTVDLSPALKRGKNVLAVVAYFCHTETSRYTEKNLGLCFEVTSGGKTLCASGKNALSRLSRTYESGAQVPLITGQIGYSYRYDFNAEDGWLSGCAEGFSPSQELSRSVELYERPVEKLKESKNVSRAVSVGEYLCEGRYAAAAEKMQRAALSERSASFSFPNPQGAEIGAGSNVYLLVDLRQEKTGLLTFDLEVDRACSMMAGYGEHIADGRVRTHIHGRNFAFEFRLKKGRNTFTGYFRRLGAKYLCLFVDAPRVKIYDFNLLSTDYPVREKRRAFPDPLLQKIYQTSVRTLKVCMHEHYEDTPWREQALYAMDSRNQMLCGYFAFEDYRFARASLKLMSENVRADGFFTLTTPKSTDVNLLTIPCFSLVQVCAMEEYFRYSGDLGLFREYKNNYRAVLENFISLREKNGLLKAVKGLSRWNFYEWSEGLEGNFLCEPQNRYEAPLNAFFVLALRSFISLLRASGEACGRYERILQSAVSSLDLFYDQKRECFADFMDDSGALCHYSELTNSLMVLAIGKNSVTEKIAALLSGNSFLNRITLSHSIYKYEALLLAGEGYAECVLRSIGKIWGGMLERGASTFFEDEAGERAFHGAGSLSHGWSAVPAYILCKIFYPQEVREEAGL